MNKKLLVLLLTASGLFLMVVLVLRPMQNKTTEDNLQIKTVVREEEEKEINYSRITFFNTQSVKASMNIPEDWEGKYRLRDQGTVAKIYYIGEAPLEVGLLEVYLRTEEDWQEGVEGGEELEAWRHEGAVVTYKLSTLNVDKLESRNEYELMQETIIELVKTMKIN